ncbi:MAG: hypothetical protein ACREIO_03625, partial [Nitrospiraceae bacterium]
IHTGGWNRHRAQRQDDPRGIFDTRLLVSHNAVEPRKSITAEVKLRVHGTCLRTMPTIVIVIIIGIRLIRTDHIPVIAITIIAIIAICQNNGRREGHRQSHESRCVKKFYESHDASLLKLRSFAAGSLWGLSEQLSCQRDFPYQGHKDIEVVNVSLSSLQPHKDHKEMM